jgi:hypothetical protein
MDTVSILSDLADNYGADNVQAAYGLLVSNADIPEYMREIVVVVESHLPELAEKQQLVSMIEKALAARYVAATREDADYNHGEYERWQNVSMGLILAFVDGDENYAQALELAWLDSQESIGWYLSEWSRNELVSHFNLETNEKIMHRLGIWED